MARSAAESLTRLKSLDAVKQRRAATVLGALLADAASECEGGSSCFLQKFTVMANQLVLPF